MVDRAKEHVDKVPQYIIWANHNNSLIWNLRQFLGMIPLINHDSRARSHWGRDEICPDIWFIYIKTYLHGRYNLPILYYNQWYDPIQSKGQGFKWFKLKHPIPGPMSSQSDSRGSHTLLMDMAIERGTQKKQAPAAPSICLSLCKSYDQWPFQDPKLEVPTIYKAYFSGLCKGKSLQNMALDDTVPPF